MKNFREWPIIRNRYLVAIIAGLLLAAAFPKIGLSGLAWIGPGLIVAAALGKSGAQRFRIGYMAGLAYYLAGLYWLLLIPYRWHSIPLGPAAGWVALSAYLALYPAVWVWIVGEIQSPKSKVQSGESADDGRQGRFKKRAERSGDGLVPGIIFPVGRGRPRSFLDSAVDARESTWLKRTVWALCGAAVWVALEMIVSRLFSGFPWDLLGVSQYQLLPLIQIASVTGVYGVSFMVVWVSLSLLSAALMIMRRPTLRSAWVGEIILPFVVAAIVCNFGFRQLRHEAVAARTLKVTFVQPSIPQTVIWNVDKGMERFGDLVRLSEQALTNETDLLLWPEAAVPGFLRYHEEIFQPVTNLAGSRHVWMIIGGDDMEPRPGSSKSEERDYFNSSFLISPEGRLAASYRKRALVIFGEFIPLEHWMSFFKYFTPSEGSFTPGERAVQYELRDRKVKTSVLICFEDVFPHLAREYADEDTDFLVNITNNGWFGEGAAQWQHATSSLFRAVENGLPLIRCSNNGLTCWVDAHGRLRKIFRDQKGSVYGPGCMTAEIPLLGDGEKRAPTFYHQHGDWFGWGCVGVAGVALVVKVTRLRRMKQKL